MSLIGKISGFFSSKSQNKKTAKTDSVQKEKKEKKDKKKTKPKINTEAIKDWQKQVQEIQEHPLSQARIINTNLLDELTRQLGVINDKLDNLEKLNEILEILRKNEFYVDKVDSENINDITIKDKEALETIDRVGSVEAMKLARLLKISRSTASLRLNRLHSFGFLEKFSKGKTIFYRLKGKYKKKED